MNKAATQSAAPENSATTVNFNVAAECKSHSRRNGRRIWGEW